MRGLGQSLALILITDGLITATLSRRFLVWQRRLAPVWYKPVLDRLLGIPERSLRLGAAVEVALGALWLAHLLRPAAMGFEGVRLRHLKSI